LSVGRQGLPGGDGGYRRLDALVALVRLQNGVEHICDTGQPLLGVICLLDESFIDAFLRLVIGAADQSLE